MRLRRLSLQYYSSDEHQWLDGQPIVRRVSNREIELVEPYRAFWMEGGAVRMVQVEAGYRCDLSSIPRIFHSVVPKTGLHDGPSVIHDKCYETLWSSRKDSDQLFRAAMRVAGVFWLRRQVIYYAVRAGGWVIWNKRLAARSQS